MSRRYFYRMVATANGAQRVVHPGLDRPLGDLFVRSYFGDGLAQVVGAEHCGTMVGGHRHQGVRQGPLDARRTDFVDHLIAGDGVQPRPDTPGALLE